MQVTLNKEAENKIVSFTKYAQFISEKFGVTVQFDGIKAHTDGTVITLPNLLGMSQREIDFLYGILLHEVGHIKYSTFTREAFEMLKTEAHFSIANAIEDARIENLLMDEYDGAHKVFEDLYNNYTQDKVFMKKLFGFSLDDVDDFKGLTTYLHYQLIELNKKLTLKEVLGPKVSKKVEKFVLDNKVDQLLAKTELNSWEDVIKLSNKIYDLFFASKKDASDKNFLPAMVEVIDETLNKTLEEIKKNSQKQVNKISELNSKAKSLREQIEQFKEANKSEIQSLKEQIEQLEQLDDKINDYSSNLEKFQEKTQKVNNFQNKAKTKEETLKELEKRVQELSEKITQEADQEKKTRLEQKLKSAQDNLKRQQEIKNNYEEKAKNHSKMGEEFKKEFEKLSPDFQNMSKEELEKKSEELSKQLSDLYSKLNKLEQGIQKTQNELSSINMELKSEREAMNSKLTDEIQKLQKQMDKAGIPISLIPAFEKTPGWEEADAVQMDFDQRATQESGDIVTNGAGFGKGGRDILTLLDKAKNDLEAIDVAKIFKEKNHVSKLDELNDFSQINKTNEEFEDGKILSAMRKHIPLTTRFDKVVLKNHASGSDLYEIRKNYAHIIKKAKEIFRLKMKSNKKDKFKGGQEEGQLDARSLWRLATKTDNNFYEINQPRHINNVAASIAIDVSGSMDKDYTEHGKRLKELSLFLSDALSECYVKHEICGYHAPVSHEMRELEKAPVFNRTSNVLETVVYKQFNDKTNSGIQNIEINCTDNCDGESLKLMASRLLKERAKRRVMFVITDGKPYLSDSDVAVLDQDLKNTLLWCHQNKVEVYAFGFNKHGIDFYGERFCHIKTYQDFLDFCLKKLGCS